MSVVVGVSGRPAFGGFAAAAAVKYGGARKWRLRGVAALGVWERSCCCPHSTMDSRFTRGKSAILERSLTRPKTEVSLSAFSLLFSEIVQYCQNRVYSVSELQNKLSELGQQGPVWKALFGREADKLEQANDDDKTYYIIEKEPLINTYISVPRENSTLNCASFTAGIVEAVLTCSGFPAKVTAHWHKGTTLMIKFDEAVIARDKALDGR
ncbi:trafficking protein particle complex subunit 5 [Alligator mississippiensis]|uniref:Trafficking protein particle complex subunit 5 n=1 Tax=Alligator mississippiensis TaxID=8496 RepID=A0A151P7E9_ALLMI|nr:trafficking protein particle complex subunit 5 [Alligator mississippiensis]